MNVGNEEPLGYFVCDVERAGPYCMMAEKRGQSSLWRPVLPRFAHRQQQQSRFPAVCAAVSRGVFGSARTPQCRHAGRGRRSGGRCAGRPHRGPGDVCGDCEHRIPAETGPGGDFAGWHHSGCGVRAPQAAADGKLTLQLDPAELRTLRIQ